MSSVDGEFIPGLAVRTKAGGFQFLPGLHTGDMYQLGQFVETGDDGEVAFTRGQVMISSISGLVKLSSRIAPAGAAGPDCVPC